VKRAVIAAVLLVVLVATILATLPVGSAVRWMLARSDVEPDALTFTSAHLRWDGVVLDDVSVALGAGNPLHLSWLKIRPSLQSLLRFGDGLPLSLTAPTCDGWMDGRIERTASGHRVAGVWTDVDLAACVDTVAIPGDVMGRLQGRIDLTLGAHGARHGSGVVRAHHIDWSMPGIPRHFPTRADGAELQWDLDGPRFTLRRFDAENDELLLDATGTVDLTEPWGESVLDVLLTITPRPGMRQAHRDFLMSLNGGPPDRRGARAFRLSGTIGRPLLERP